ncbi:MAG: hypothetical protein OHK0022_14390 [Roseiflexaceae bacterium]
MLTSAVHAALVWSRAARDCSPVIIDDPTERFNGYRVRKPSEKRVMTASFQRYNALKRLRVL